MAGAVGLVPGRNLVTPPELSRDGPILDVLEPMAIGCAPVRRHKADGSFLHYFEGHLGDAPAREETVFRCWLGHCDKPLVGEHRLDHCAAPVAARNREPVGLYPGEQPLPAEVGNNPLACLEAIEPEVALRNLASDLRIQTQNGAQFELMTLRDRVVVEVMRRGDLDHAGAEGPVDEAVGDDRNQALAKRQPNRLTDQVPVALVLRMHHHCAVAKHGFRPGGGNRQHSRTVVEWVVDLPEKPAFLFAHHFEV